MDHVVYAQESRSIDQWFQVLYDDLAIDKCGVCEAWEGLVM